MTSPAKEAISQASIFLKASIPQTPGPRLIQRLQAVLPPSWSSPLPTLEPVSQTIVYPTALLKTIAQQVDSEHLELGAKDWIQINALGDFIVILGIYKLLSVGVGVSEEKRGGGKILTREARDVEIPGAERRGLLQFIIGTLKEILDQGGVVAENFRRRYLVHYLSGICELAFNPSYPAEVSEPFKLEYTSLLLRLPLSVVLESVTTILHPKTPEWLRTVLTRKSSSILLEAERHGVRAVVLFFLGKYQEPTTTDLQRIAEVVGSIPSWLTPEEYITQIGPQVIGLFDEKDPLVQNAGVQIIHSLYRKYQNPASRGFVEAHTLDKIASPFLPLLVHGQPYGDYNFMVIYDDLEIEKAVNRIEVVASNQVPGLTNALKPALKNLFLLAVYTSTHPQSKLNEQIMRIFEAASSSLDSPADWLLSLVSEMFDNNHPVQTGDPSKYSEWEYAPGDHGGVAIRVIGPDVAKAPDFEEISVRISVFLEITANISEQAKTDVFVDILRLWLSPDSSLYKTDNELTYCPLDLCADTREFGIAQLLNDFLARYQDDLLKSPASLLSVCAEILSNYISSKSRKKPLAYMIVRDKETDEEENGLVEIAFNLVSTVAAESIQHELSDEELSVYRNCVSSLEQLISSSNGNLNLRKLARRTLSLINTRLSMASETAETQPSSDAAKFLRAMEHIADPLAPVRAQGIATLRDLILHNSSAIKIPAVLKTLIELLQDDDSFVYLNAIKVLQLLADIHGVQITETLLQEYGSPRNVDERLRLAEALAGVIQRMGSTFTGPFAKDTMAVISHLVSSEEDWRVRVSGIGVMSVCVEVSPSEASVGIEMALHLFKINDLTFTEQGDDAAPLRRGAVTIIAGVLRGGGIDALGSYTRDVVRSIRYLVGSDEDETVRELAQGVLDLFGGAIEIPESMNTRWNVKSKIQGL